MIGFGALGGAIAALLLFGALVLTKRCVLTHLSPLHTPICFQKCVRIFLMYVIQLLPIVTKTFSTHVYI